jgi:hypothetical protein
MNQQDRQKTDNQQSEIIDLSVNEDQAEEVKGGDAGRYSAIVFVGGWGA